MVLIKLLLLFIQEMEGKMKLEKYLCLVLIVLILLFVPSSFAQDAAGSLRGQVADPSGAAISGAAVVMTPATGSPIVVQSNAQGMFEFKTLPAGKYTPNGLRYRIYPLRKRQRRNRRSTDAAQRGHGDCR